jgi:hypothetical protein
MRPLACGKAAPSAPKLPLAPLALPDRGELRPDNPITARLPGFRPSQRPVPSDLAHRGTTGIHFNCLN